MHTAAKKYLLTLGLGGALGLAGCAGDDGSGASGSDGTSDSATGGTGGTGTGTGTTGSGTTDGTTTGNPGNCADPSDANAMKEGISTEIMGDRTLTCDTLWVLEDLVFVRGGTLTVEAGTTILGLSGSALIIEKDARIDVQGTAEQPVVMTSNQPAGSRNRGDWGGLVLLGTAPINLQGGSGQAEGFANPPTYGGDDPTHDCGSLRYLRVEFAGFEISAGSELNGITYYACGTDTVVDHVQSHMGADDGMEMFGGGFDAKYVVVTGAADDSLDCDQGFRGNLQYVYAQQDPALGDNALEWSNQGTDFTAQPLTGPTLVNATLVGSGAGGEKSKGTTLKEGTEAFIHSTIFMGFTNEAVLMTHPETQASAEAGGITIMNTLFFGNGSPQFNTDKGTSWTGMDLADFVLNAMNSNLDGMDPGLGSTQWGDPNPVPAAGSPVAGAGATPSGFESNDYIGAFEPGGENWMAGWTNFASN